LDPEVRRIVLNRYRELEGLAFTQINVAYVSGWLDCLRIVCGKSITELTEDCRDAEAADHERQ